ncbi:DUF2690 domain-containing protein [Streptomyces sp. NPDC058960]|uniref:DUF2690 domain-containing protein n=1 Tax=Streptomyces sp. NPDC058960 TaxID=3346679 RepID=UPI003677FA12
MRAWVRGHGPQTLVGSVLVTVIGAVASVLLTAALGDDPGGSTGGSAAAEGTVGALTGPSTPPGCHGEECDGLDPETTRCGAGARTLRGEWAGTMYLAIRYSPACHTVWGKLTGAEVGDTVEIRTSPNRRQVAEVAYGHTKYTPMLPAPESRVFTAQATAVAVNPKKREVAHGHVMTVGAGAADLQSATPNPTSTPVAEGR